jgi:hypothetical protein
MTGKSAYKIVIDTFGKPILSYVLDLDEAELDTLEASGSLARPVLRQLLDEVVDTLIKVKVQAALQDLPVSLAVRDVKFVDGTGRQESAFNVWRARAGGSLPDFHTGDALVDALCPALTETYPLILMAPYLSKSSPFHGGLYPLARIEWMKSSARAVLADPELSKMFPRQSQSDLDSGTDFASSAGVMGGMQLSLFGDSLISSSYSMMRLRGHLSVPDFRNAITETVALTRRLASGKETKVPAWIGIGNVAMPEGSADLPWGVIRPHPYPTDLELIPSSARPSVTNDSSGEYTLAVILETTFDYQVAIGKNDGADSSGAWRAKVRESYSRLEERYRQTAFAIALSTEREQPAACTRLWTAVFDPMSHGVRLSFTRGSNPPVAFHRLSPRELKVVNDWATSLHSRASDKMEIPQRRILSAIAERSDPVDGFVDAVIAWEALFAGTEQGELVFRICAAMATLLCDETDDRMAKHKKLKELYNKRSKVLHGARHIELAEAVEARDFAVIAALDCMKRLYKEFPDLLSDTNRGSKIILSL